VTGVVDSHTHLLPGRLARAIRAYFDEHLTADLAYPLDDRTVLDRHRADGIEAVWTLPYAHRPAMADELNRSVRELAAALADHPVEVVAGCTVHVADHDPAAIVGRAIDAGARVVKLHCSVGRYEADDPRLDPVFAVAAERAVPVVVHLGHATSGHTEAHELTPVERVATRHPGCPVIIAHCGHRAHRRALDLVAGHPNVHADLTPVVADPVPLAAADASAHHDRLLFGTDAPNTAVPACDLLARVRSWSLAPDEEAAILGGNARRLVAVGRRSAPVAGCDGDRPRGTA
jgi:uncharacterized protein